jgi:hypothetical protein
MLGSRENGQGDAPRPGALRRLAGRRNTLPRSDSERIAAVAAGAHVPVEDVLREVADFRLALETDMIIAAAAVDADAPELLSEVVDDERLELASFHDRLLARLADAAADDEIAVRRARKAPRLSWTTRAVAAAAAALAVFGMTRTVGTGTELSATNAAAMQTADQHYADFSSAVTSHRPGAVSQAARQLHETLQSLISEHANDPNVAQRAAQLLQAEISLLRANDPDGASYVLAQARNLVTLLERKASPQVRASVQPVLDAAVSTTAPKKPRAKASSSPSATPSPTPSPTPTKTSSTESADPDDKGPLDTP